jgi:putative tricarboxylic transport membrane protein
MPKKRFGVLLTALAVYIALFAGCSAASAARTDYPVKNAEMIVTSAAGGGSDTFARMLVKVIAAEKLYPKTITVINKPGGSSAIGYGYTANQPADGYTLAIVSSSFFTGPATGRSPVAPDDFEEVAALAFDPALLIVEQNSPYKSLADLIAYAKENPGKVSCAGSQGHSNDRLMFEALVRGTGVKINYIPFDSSSESVAAVMGKHADFTFASPSETISQLQAHLVRAIAISSDERFSALPDIATLKELGVDFSLFEFRSVIVPKGTPVEIKAYLSDMFGKVAKSETWKKEYLEPYMLQGVFLGYEEAEKKKDELNALYKEMISQIEL